MSRTNIDVDDVLVVRVMTKYRLPSKKAAVNFALKQVGGTTSREEALKLEGIGWDGDLVEMRQGRIADL